MTEGRLPDPITASAFLSWHSPGAVPLPLGSFSYSPFWCRSSSVQGVYSFTVLCFRTPLSPIGPEEPLQPVAVSSGHVPAPCFLPPSPARSLVSSCTFPGPALKSPVSARSSGSFQCGVVLGNPKCVPKLPARQSQEVYKCA